MTTEDLANSDEDNLDPESIEWRNIIFLPFHLVFRLLILCIVLVKSMMGPLQAIFPYLQCTHVLDPYPTAEKIITCYIYSDIVYGIDTFLHIVHRQVAELAMTREHLPKSTILIIIDIIVILPLFNPLEEHVCLPVQLWPNILGFLECLVAYRVVEFFSLKSTHSIFKLIVGYAIMIVLVINCVACFILLLTFNGVCPNCKNGTYDWRAYVAQRFPEVTKNNGVETYIFGVALSHAYLVAKLADELKPNTNIEFIVGVLLMIVAYLINIFIVRPKFFAETILRLRQIHSFHPRVIRVIEETNRRSPTAGAHVSVENFYSLIWTKRHGTTTMPEVINELPRYLRVEIEQYLIWPLFHHSPTLRNISSPCKRSIGQYIKLEYKLPEERFYVGAHCLTNMYYLKTGIVQFYSDDDSVSPILSVTSGTLLGDVSFMTPPYGRRAIVRCLTYCEVLILSRKDILNTLHKFPKDRQHTMSNIKSKLEHARTLYSCKAHIQGTDRCKDEGMQWIKKRWWEISHSISGWKRMVKIENTICGIPGEESTYHCAKYLGQLVLCGRQQLQRNAIFANVTFPWILAPESNFTKIWNELVLITVYCVLIIYPPTMLKNHWPIWFKIFRFLVDIIYVLDIMISLITAGEKFKERTIRVSTVMFTRCKCPFFILDVLSTIGLEFLASFCGYSLWKLSMSNRLIKTYRIFFTELTPWNRKKNPLVGTFIKVMTVHFVFIYVGSCILYYINDHYEIFSTEYVFGRLVCPQHGPNKCDQEEKGMLYIIVGFICELVLTEVLPLTFKDLIVGMLISCFSYLLLAWTGTHYIGALYLSYRETTLYHYFATNLRKHYIHHKIHPHLLKRLNKYLEFHWRYYKGMDVLHPDLLKDEPYDIYWKIQGELATKTIKSSKAFLGADAAMIRDLALHSKFLVLPATSTMFLFGAFCKNITWVVKGETLCEYHDADGNLVRRVCTSGEMLSCISVFLKQPALRTFIAATDCEILYIHVKDFFNILNRYPLEKLHVDDSLTHFGPQYAKLYNSYVLKYKNYQKSLRERIFHAEHSIGNKSQSVAQKFGDSVVEMFGCTIEDPESPVIVFWFMFRSITVVVSIVTASLKGGSGAEIRSYLMIISAVCDMIGMASMFIKIFLPFYNSSGLLISSYKLSLYNYLSRGFILDLIGVIPLPSITEYLSKTVLCDNYRCIINLIAKYSHLYIVIGFLNYIADVPSGYGSFILIFKWQLVIILIMMGSATYYTGYCINFTWDESGNIMKMQKLNSCWILPYFKLDNEITSQQLHFVYAESLNFAQCGLMRMNLGMFTMDTDKFKPAFVFVTIGMLFWYLMCYSQTLLVLYYRGDSIYEQSVKQLTVFLKSERVEEELLNRTLAHFNYCWIRTQGLNSQTIIMNERVGVVFRQDLNFYFYKKTFFALDSLIHGGESLRRRLANISTTLYLLPGSTIMREMDLITSIFLVHRGKIVITKEGETKAVLTKGSIFGQLRDSKIRPVRVTASALEHVDVLVIQLQHFHEAINDKIRRTIARNLDSENDFMRVEHVLPENAYNSIEYILRGRKTVKFPWMHEPVEIHSNFWYKMWYYNCWLWQTALAIVLTLILLTLQFNDRVVLLKVLLVIDLIHFVNIASEFCSMEVVVVNNKCINKYVGLRKFCSLGIYIDILSLIVPWISFYLPRKLHFHLFRLLRLNTFFKFYEHFCRNCQATSTSMVMKFVIVVLLLHTLTCGWMIVACGRSKYDEYENLNHIYNVPTYVNQSVDPSEWVFPLLRKAGCSRATVSYMMPESTQKLVHFVVPKYWFADYVIALTYIFILHTHTNMDSIVPLTIIEIYYKIVVCLVLYMIEIWISSVTISTMYTKYRDAYQYDYYVSNLVTYLRHNGILDNLLDSVTKYTRLLWQRQRGTWLPEITNQAPICLREDILCSLYLHHLKSPNLFALLPDYFLRQLAVRLKRVVIFPGKSIVLEGDIFSCIYFIHEGEVERWGTGNDGENRLISMLGLNDFFGLIPGLFCNVPFKYTYVSRTVVDLIFLKYIMWQDLLDGYPDIKETFYKAAQKMKDDYLR